MHRFAPLLYSMCWLLHVSAEVSHHQGGSRSVLSYVKIQIAMEVYLKYIK
jgi:hypothetical protein